VPTKRGPPDGTVNAWDDSGGFDLGASVEPFLEEPAQVLAGHRGVAARALRLDADLDHHLVPRPVATGVALRLGERSQPAHGRTLGARPDGKALRSDPPGAPARGATCRAAGAWVAGFSFCSVERVTTVAFDVHAIRGRFPGLSSPLAFFDGPGGTQVPDSVIDAVASYYRESNANVGGPYETSRRTEALIAQAHLTAAEFLGCSAEETVCGANMTTLSFALTRAAARGWSPGDAVVVTQLDHDANIAPWLELARDLQLDVRVARMRDDTTLDEADLAAKLDDRVRVVAFPLASNALGTLIDARRIAALAHESGALAWADAVHFAPHGPIDVAALGVDVLICSPYKFFGPHLGVAFGRAELLDSWRPYKVRPAPNEPIGQRFETGTLPHELLAGFVAAVEYIESVGWEAIQAQERMLGERFLAGLAEQYTLHGLPTMDGRVPTFAFTHGEATPRDVATRLGDEGIAVWWGDYYAVEVMQRLGLPKGAVRAGFVHYNTAEEVDRLLEALSAF
jgi:cysteine desulfurase family protein (TIGR01976 family)